MGTNKRYADSIDRRAAERAPRHPGPETGHAGTPAAGRQDAPPAPQPRAWQPPWPPIRVAETEWIVMRDAKSEPAAVIRTVRMGPRNELFYRVVTWAPTSEGRSLVGYYPTFELADRAVLFRPASPVV